MRVGRVEVGVMCVREEGGGVSNVYVGRVEVWVTTVLGRWRRDRYVHMPKLAHFDM